MPKAKLLTFSGSLSCACFLKDLLTSWKRAFPSPFCVWSQNPTAQQGPEHWPCHHQSQLQETEQSSLLLVATSLHHPCPLDTYEHVCSGSSWIPHWIDVWLTASNLCRAVMKPTGPINLLTIPTQKSQDVVEGWDNLNLVDTAINATHGATGPQKYHSGPWWTYLYFSPSVLLSYLDDWLMLSIMAFASVVYITGKV